MDLGLTGKVALVTPGGAIAEAIAARLRSEGCTVTADERHPDLHILVWCGHSDICGRIDEIDSEKMKNFLQNNLLVPWDLVRRVAPAMRKRRRGRIVFVVDAAAKVPGVEALPASVCGAAQLALVKSLSDDLGRDGVLVNAVCVSQVSGHPARAIAQPYIGRSLEQQESQWGRDVPLARRGTPEDIANAVAYLASERASFVLGANIDVDGGYQRSYI
ncbi:MAG TPA: SDR family oxidoreductase [Burkholderiales bacterium]|nr:SDR family oxidoreductase [Burkholderiales bacterium]